MSAVFFEEVKKEVSRKDKDNYNDQEPWEQPIYDDHDGQDYDGYSRADKRYNDEGRNWYVIILVILLFLIVLVSVGAVIYFNMSTKMNSGTAKDNNVVVQSSSTTESSSSSSKTSGTTSSSTTSSTSSTTSSSSTSSTSSTFEDVEVKANEAQDNQSNTTNQNAAASGSTVTYGQGDSTRSLWMIAQSNGMTVDELYALNPGIDATNIQEGQEIRIK